MLASYANFRDAPSPGGIRAEPTPVKRGVRPVDRPVDTNIERSELIQNGTLIPKYMKI
jgi:hypothetical protein